MQMESLLRNRGPLRKVKYYKCELILKVLVATIDAQWEEMGDVGSAWYKLALLPLSLTIKVLSYSN